MIHKNLLILGAGGHGRVVKEIAEAMGIFEKIDFLDDNSELAIGKLEHNEKFAREYRYAFPAFGNNSLRMSWMKKLEENGFKIPVLVHPSTYISPSASVCTGTVIQPKAMINTNSVIERGCIIGLGAIVDHDSFIGFGCHIDCGAVVKAHCVVMAQTKIESKQVVTRDDNKL